MNNKLLYSLGILFSSSLEMYTYMLFPFIQSILLSSFYHGANNIGFLIFFLAALCRPFGSCVFGYLGDCYGRKYSLILSLLLMSCSCCLILFSPRYEQVGNYAVFGLVMARIMQVLSVSGEHAGVAISLIESWKGKEEVFYRYGLASGLVYLFSMFGTFLATLVVCKLDVTNWYYAYVLSFVLVIACFLLRFIPNVEPVYMEATQALDDKMFGNFVACLFISAAMSSLYYFNTVFMGTYFLAHGVESFKEFSALYLLLYMFATCFWGWLSDFIEHLYLFILIPCCVLFVSLFFTLYYCNPWLHCFNIVMLAMYAGPSHAYFFKLFSQKYRYRAISIAYGLGTALIGSSTPLIASFLMSRIVLIMYYLCFVLGLAILGVFLSSDSLRNC